MHKKTSLQHWFPHCDSKMQFNTKLAIGMGLHKPAPALKVQQLGSHWTQEVDLSLSKWTWSDSQLKFMLCHTQIQSAQELAA